MEPDALRADSIFLMALETPTAEERSAYLDGACGSNQELRERVERLLAAHLKVSAFLELPAPALAMTADEPISERPGTLIGPYKLMEQIGEGGMGLVFVAEQQRPIRRKVALKVIKPGMDTRAVVARFESERQALALMDHPNIAKVLDGGESAGGRPYFVMELVKGVAITQFCDDHRFNTRERLELFIHVCDAVQHAHQKGIIHRDIKPSNVLVVSHDGKPVVKVIDFGVAKAIGQHLTDKTIYTQFSQLIGTPLYMSPEQAGESGLDIDTRSDIYALGVLLYELLTGTTPFDREYFKTAGYDEMRRIIREVEPPRPSTRITTLGQAAATISTQRRSDPRRLSQMFRGELDWIVMKCLEKDRERRYGTTNSLEKDIERYLHDEPVHACPPSAAYRLRKFVRRNRGPVLSVSIIAMLLLAAIVGTTIGLVRATLAEISRKKSEQVQTELVRANVDELWHAADLRQVGAFVKVRDYIGEKIKQLPEEPEHAYARELLEQKRALAGQLAKAHDQLLHQSYEAWFVLVGEQHWGEAHRACKLALASFGVLTDDHWWRQPLLADLTDRQKSDLNREVYRLLLFLATIHVQQGLESYRAKIGLTQEVDDAARSASAVLARARAMENAGLLRPSLSAGILEKGARKLTTLPKSAFTLLNLIEKPPASDKPYVIPVSFPNDPDCFFIGNIHHLLGMHPNDSAAKVMRYLLPDEFDYINPLDTAERLLRQAVVADPRDYWAWSVLGGVFRASKDWGAAEVAYSSCVTLQPDYLRGYEGRGLVLVYRALQTEKSIVRQELIRQAERDSQTAASKAPHNPATYWMRGDMDRIQGKYRAAVDSYAHALVLVDQLQQHFDRRNRLTDIENVAKKVLAENPSDADALALAALCRLARAEKGADIAKVAGDFQAFVDRAPHHLLLRLGSGKALERLAAAADSPEPNVEPLRQAQAAYEAGWKIAPAGIGDTWKQVEACKGQARVLLRLQQPHEAEQAWQEARRLDPALPSTMPSLGRPD
jgi:serine/threonine protein kinase/tetratricopeptide (TPR) repeat protein